MPTETKFNFDNSYLQLPDHFFEKVETQLDKESKFSLFNTLLAKELGVSTNAQAHLGCILENQSKIETYAQAYAGHQFGYFNRLGDGRAIMLGEHITTDGLRFDIQLKGGGSTKFSRGGDGKATYKSMLREYIMSEAMHHLGIPTSRSLGVIKTGEHVYREIVHEGAALIRVMKSHLRIGTFQYAAHLASAEDVDQLTVYTLKRLFPELLQTENPAIALLEKLMQNQIELVTNWMRIGFIHGVMNTDNISISCETFDYGPCAFMNTYHPQTVFSSIDRNARYAFGNQPHIIKWDLMRFAEALLPVIHKDKEVAVELAQASIQKFDALWNTTYYGKMLQKLGFSQNDRRLYPLVDEFLGVLQKNKMDYTNSFMALADEIKAEDKLHENDGFSEWYSKWKKAIDKHTTLEEAIALMKKTNPVLIPRNHLVEQALDEAVKGNMLPFETLLKKLATPYDYTQKESEFMHSPKLQFDKNYQTFCGT
jgi:uncharacterized protein YdiU (UPF0061 family)